MSLPNLDDHVSNGMLFWMLFRTILIDLSLLGIFVYAVFTAQPTIAIVLLLRFGLIISLKRSIASIREKVMNLNKLNKP